MSDTQVPTPLSAEQIEHYRRGIRYSPVPKILDSHELLRAQLDAKDLRIAELEAPRIARVQIGTSVLSRDLVWCQCGRGLSLSGKWSFCPNCGKQIDQDSYDSSVQQAKLNGASHFYRDPEMVEQLISLRSRYDRLLDEREAILSRLPPDSPCKHAETGHSVADDVGGLVRDKAEAEKRRDLFRREVGECHRMISCRNDVFTDTWEPTQLPPRLAKVMQQLAASEAARKKAEEERDEVFTDEAGTGWRRPTAWAYMQTCKSLHKAQEERDALRQGLEKCAEILDAMMWSQCGETDCMIPLHVSAWKALAAARALLQPETPATYSPEGSYCSICNVFDQWCPHLKPPKSAENPATDTPVDFADIARQRDRDYEGPPPTDKVEQALKVGPHAVPMTVKERIQQAHSLVTRELSEPWEDGRDTLVCISTVLDIALDQMGFSPTEEQIQQHLVTHETYTPGRITARPVERSCNRLTCQLMGFHSEECESACAPVEWPIQVGDTVRQKVHGWTAIVKSIQPDPVYGGFAIFEEPGGFWRLSQLERVEDGKP